VWWKWVAYSVRSGEGEGGLKSWDDDVAESVQWSCMVVMCGGHVWWSFVVIASYRCARSKQGQQSLRYVQMQQGKEREDYFFSHTYICSQQTFSVRTHNHTPTNTTTHYHAQIQRNAQGTTTPHTTTYHHTPTYTTTHEHTTTYKTTTLLHNHTHHNHTHHNHTNTHPKTPQHTPTHTTHPTPHTPQRTAPVPIRTPVHGWTGDQTSPPHLPCTHHPLICTHHPHTHTHAYMHTHTHTHTRIHY